MLTSDRIIRLFAGHTTFMHFCAVSNCILQPTGSSEVISGRLIGLTVPDKCVKFRDPRLNGSREIRPKAVGCGIFGRFSNFSKCLPAVAGDVIFGVTSGYVSADARLWGRMSPISVYNFVILI